MNGRGSIRESGKLFSCLLIPPGLACKWHKMGAMLYLLWNKKSWRCPVGTMLGQSGLTHHISLCWVFGSSPKGFAQLHCTFKMLRRGERDTDAQMCSGSIKACALVLGACAVPTVCQTLVIIWTPAACLQFSPSCFFFLLDQLISSCLSYGRHSLQCCSYW